MTADIIDLREYIPPVQGDQEAAAKCIVAKQTDQMLLAWEHCQKVERYLAAGNIDAARRYNSHAKAVLERGS